MEAKLASLSLKSPGLLPSSPTARTFSAPNQARQSLVLEPSSNFLSPDSANNNSVGGGGSNNSSNQDAAATLAQQRAKLKASNAAHRISAPVLSMAGAGADGRNAWGPASLQQVVEANAAPQEVVVKGGGARPKSTEGSTGGPVDLPMSPPVGDSWANMVNTPLIPMFQKETTGAHAAKVNEWGSGVGVGGGPPGVPRMGDPKIHRRTAKAGGAGEGGNGNQVYGDDGNPIVQAQPGRGGVGRGNGGGGAWGTGNTRSPALGSDGAGAGVGGAVNPTGNNAGGGNPGAGMNLNGLGMGMGGFMGSPPLGMGMPGLGVMPGANPFNMNMLVSPEVQLLAAQMAASGFGQPGWMGMQAQSAGVIGGMGVGGGGGGGNRRGPPSARSLPGGLKSASSVGSRGLDSAGSKGEEDVDPALLNDVPGWLRSLRLHKYTPNFEGMGWREMVMLDEAALEAKGVAALGARRKMLKTFEVVRRKLGIEGGPVVSP